MVRGKERLSDNVVLLRLGDPEGRPLPGWSPGSHIDVVLPNGLVRPYSLCGDTTDRDEWRLLIGRETESRGGSAFVHDRLDRGDHLDYLGPRCRFRLRGAGRYLFLAGGLGIAPLIPMARLVAASHLPWSMVVVGPEADVAPITAMLTDLLPRITLLPTGEDARPDLTAPLTGLDPGTAIYACGSDRFVDAVEQISSRSGLTVNRQLFTAGTPRGGDDKPVELVLARSGLTFTVQAGTSLATGLRQLGVRVPVSCGAGICGACLVKVVAGVPDHRDRLLSTEQRGRGDSILTCVSRAHTPRLVLDL
ncbi:PDR/VanB family oxidoreductase [Actinomadura opuntiae]|uniref:PDR/VanB family oxidoreductase n=1 Tax=Actinomadura sp. OS1-43 TaxID=604315 RepID=UPI00255AE1AC|nr:PDR/VanB family oxidoreductase [Actinomadura sp. OS1-43]MDL4814243.1 PDR/VanB family oxidoreductase [Actinomadura sp. OS1-43]